MAFDAKKFSQAKFVPRQENVGVSSEALKAFFDEGDTPQFTVRGLTGEEMARANEAQNSQRQKNINALVNALAGTAEGDQVKQIRESLGLGQEELSADLARRLTMLQIGSVDPELTRELAVKVFNVAPVDAYELTNKIMVLSGQGMSVGEQKASGGKKKSKKPATSGTPEEKCSTS